MKLFKFRWHPGILLNISIPGQWTFLPGRFLLTNVYILPNTGVCRNCRDVFTLVCMYLRKHVFACMYECTYASFLDENNASLTELEFVYIYTHARTDRIYLLAYM